MGYTTISVDVDIDEFNEEDIIEKAVKIARGDSGYEEIIKQALSLISIEEMEEDADPSDVKFETVIEQLKYDFFIQNFDKITLEQLESLLK